MGLDIKKGNKAYEFSNLNVNKLLESKAFGLLVISRNHVNNAAAKTAGLAKGDIYHNAGVLMVVI